MVWLSVHLYYSQYGSSYAAEALACCRTVSLPHFTTELSMLLPMCACMVRVCPMCRWRS